MNHLTTAINQLMRISDHLIDAHWKYGDPQHTFYFDGWLLVEAVLKQVRDEAEALEQLKTQAQAAVRKVGRHKMPTLRSGKLPELRPSPETQIHNG